MDNTFFRLGGSLSSSALRGTADPDAYDQLVRAKRGSFLPARPIIVHRDSGSIQNDFMWVSLEPLIHRRIGDLLELSTVTGWSTYPVEVHDRDGALAGFCGLAITGRCQSIFLDKNHSELVYEVTSRGQFPYYKGLSITVDSWDGSDFFMSADGQSEWIVVTRKVRDLFRKANVTNIRMEPVSQVRVHAMDQPVLQPTT